MFDVNVILRNFIYVFFHVFAIIKICNHDVTQYVWSCFQQKKQSVPALGLSTSYSALSRGSADQEFLLRLQELDRSMAKMIAGALAVLLIYMNTPIKRQA